MIGQIIKLAQQMPFYGCSENMEIFKGKNAQPKTTKEHLEKTKRNWKWQKR